MDCFYRIFKQAPQTLLTLRHPLYGSHDRCHKRCPEIYFEICKYFLKKSLNLIDFALHKYFARKSKKTSNIAYRLADFTEILLEKLNRI